MAYRQIHIGKSIYLHEKLHNFGSCMYLNGLKHMFTYYFQFKSNVHP